MLINEPKAERTHKLFTWLAKRGGRRGRANKLRTGVYEFGHTVAIDFFPEPEYDCYPETSVGSYGVCDSVEQLLEACPELEASDRKFVVTVVAMRKATQPKVCGWRWHKWGEYIGTQKPQCEYLYDEPEIKKVLVFHIFEKVVNQEQARTRRVETLD